MGLLVLGGRAREWAAGWWRSLAGSPLWEAGLGAWRTSPPRAAALIALTVLMALMPAAFALGSGALIASVPQMVAEGGLTTPAGRATLLALLGIGVSFVVQHLGPLRTQFLGDALGRRYRGRVHRRIMRAALHPATIRHLEEPELHDKVQQSLGTGNPGGNRTGIAGAPAALANLAGERVRGVAALLMVAHFSVWPALLLAAVWLHHWRRLRAVHDELIRVKLLRTPGLRYAQYVGILPLWPAGAKEIRIFGLGPWLGEKFEHTWLSEMATLWDRRRELPLRMALATLPVLAVQALTLALVARAAVLGEIGLGALIVYVNAVLQSQAFGSVTNDEVTLQYGAAGLKPLAELERSVAEDPRLMLPGTRAAAGLPRDAIRFERVWFTYPGSTEPVFRDLTLEIPTGRSLAIVGANGAGKTTLIKLLCRLYEPCGPADATTPPGRITVDGIDMREIDPRAWQRRVAAIFQDFVKYHLPAYDNVALGAPERQADRTAVEEAARRAGALDLIEALPHGWETILSREYRGGAEVSGGQWQRIGLARALFAAAAGASILVMDEPTAHLDVRAEAAFYDSFLDITQGSGSPLTTIIISHRFSTVRRADRIVVLEEGRVVEDGTHEALMAMGGRYAGLFNLQAQRFVDAARKGAPA